RPLALGNGDGDGEREPILPLAPRGTVTPARLPAWIWQAEEPLPRGWIPAAG
ncbi:unnamed protein product, partial [Urochloa humidicola]